MSYETDELMIEGITEDHFAISHESGIWKHISVHDADGEGLFTLPSGWTAEQINAAIAVYKRGFSHGEKFGAAHARRIVREALGIFH
ncbi:hypothetical protein UXJ30_35500 [Burkholderia cenocepacia]|uniref:Uncharacterized protein n=2 Tax=Burkholderia cenocepacia TaxID=95486 RepID=B4EQK5_BURCJ|nr:hypothetical protein [Burkholderia cenocepacia]KIS46029.1 hypothetical protein NP88_7371 [Burkholderia cepacia]EPZ84593.1 hypothetical protein BURCENK562V_C0114 [Burkholderia cenocepacia K56-2Valvano]ERI24640.1 hypothetical protein BURCENBC7_AP0234 [Burkholderia cenocepacia BC7]KKI81686.1 hypothetical protein WQ49_14125 [Burkholderia cenocepacia]ONR58976.1 hypothetical protein A8E17_15480 [Burkholderia cenocepacia]